MGHATGNKQPTMAPCRLHAEFDAARYCGVLVLLQRGAPPDGRDTSGATLLIKCCHLQETRTARVLVARLLRFGARRSETDSAGQTALHHAALAAPKHLTRLLLDNPDYDLNHRDQQGNTALHVAANAGRTDIVTLIIDELARYDNSVDVMNEDGLTPLMVACKYGDLETARILVGRGKASLTSRDSTLFKSPKEWLQTALCIPDNLDPFVALFTIPDVVKQQPDISQTSSRRPVINTAIRTLSKVGLSSKNNSASTFTLPLSIQNENTNEPFTGKTRRLGSEPVHNFDTCKSTNENLISSHMQTLSHFYKVQTAQISLSYRTAAKAPPPIEPEKEQENESRRASARNRMQKLMRIRKTDSVIANLKKGSNDPRVSNVSRSQSVAEHRQTPIPRRTSRLTVSEPPSPSVARGRPRLVPVDQAAKGKMSADVTTIQLPQPDQSPEIIA